MPAVDVLLPAKLSPLYVEQLEREFAAHRLPDLSAASKVRAIACGGETQLPSDLIAQLPALEIISVMGVGYDGVDVAAAKAKGVMVTHTPDVLNDDVADVAIGLMLCTSRQFPQADRFVREGKWTQGAMPLQRKMSGARLGLVGMGRIGQAIAKRALGFGMSIAYNSRTPKKELPYTFHADVRDLARASDFLVVITPGGEGTRKMINAEVLQALGKKGILVNVARGSVVDEAALIEALKNGVIGGAGLDVFENEPIVPQALRDMPHVVLTPHVGSATTQTRQAMADLAMDNLRAHFAGRPVKTPVPECRA
ncbi:2-hydroxyacid dehydrogenase [Ramlibacter sp. PS4R-6]|uniref:2-hydroxyacid dehydrogenase n=1 Tax=Ramlibacter sp. PS4R-6 TaxID=3133438 RepID=UPI0030A067D2